MKRAIVLLGLLCVVSLSSMDKDEKKHVNEKKICLRQSPGKRVIYYVSSAGERIRDMQNFVPSSPHSGNETLYMPSSMVNGPITTPWKVW